ncbi:NAD(P)-dependent oxidoreductase [Phormidium tenue FACHB-886]|nr:NAD(P)-dependent oxidoreductase [Phormidium tenue FACHB-886]
MQIVDTALKARAEAGNPVKFGVFGAGFMSKGLINQTVNYMPGMYPAVVCNRTLEAARETYAQAGVNEVRVVKTAAELEDAIAQRQYAITDDPAVVCQSESIECLVEATGHVEYGAKVTMMAIEHRKHMVLMNAELDGTVGPILKTHADRAGVILTGCDGDQPGVELNLYRFVKSIGLTPLLCGNIKGLQDRYRNPTTQAGFAKQWGQTPHMVTSFADGTKISFEQAIVANATGMKVAQRGMIGHEFRGHVDQMTGMYDIDQMRSLGGIVEYVVGAQPSPGVYVFAEAHDKHQAHYLNYGKLGEGPLYSFYVPYHLTIFEVPLSVARVVLFNDVIIAPQGAPVVDVMTTAKVDLKAGETLDGLGWYMTYGQCENYETVRAENLLPMGIAEGCRLKRDVPKDQALTYDDVELPTDTIAHKLRAEQDAFFPVKVPAAV